MYQFLWVFPKSFAPLNRLEEKFLGFKQTRSALVFLQRCGIPEGSSLHYPVCHEQSTGVITKWDDVSEEKGSWLARFFDGYGIFRVGPTLL